MEECQTETLVLRMLSLAIARMVVDRDFYYPEIAYVIRAHIDPSVRANTCVPIVHKVHLPDSIPSPPVVSDKCYVGTRGIFMDIIGHIELSILEHRPFMDIIDDIANNIHIIMMNGDYTKITSANMYADWCARQAT